MLFFLETGQKYNTVLLIFFNSYITVSNYAKKHAFYELWKCFVEEQVADSEYLQGPSHFCKIGSTNHNHIHSLWEVTPACRIKCNLDGNPTIIVPTSSEKHLISFSPPPKRHLHFIELPMNPSYYFYLLHCLPPLRSPFPPPFLSQLRS